MIVGMASSASFRLLDLYLCFLTHGHLIQRTVYRCFYLSLCCPDLICAQPIIFQCLLHGSFDCRIGFCLAVCAYRLIQCCPIASRPVLFLPFPAESLPSSYRHRLPAPAAASGQVRYSCRSGPRFSFVPSSSSCFSADSIPDRSRELPCGS